MMEMQALLFFALVTGAPAALLAPGEVELSATPAATAARLAAERPALLGLGARDAARVVRTIELRHGSVVRLQRTHQGLPVIRESATVRFDAAGQPLSLRSDFEPLPILPEPTLRRGAAVAAAIAHRLGLVIPADQAEALAVPARLAVDGRRHAVVWVVHLATALPQHQRVVLIDARSGLVLEVVNPVHRAANDANVFLPHPVPGAILNAPTVVQLQRLDTAEPLVLDGELAVANSCLTDDENVRVRTCLDILGGLPCASPDFANLMLSFCGEGHRAASAGETEGFKLDPVDDLSDYGVDAWPMEDAFAEVHAYYHLDAVSEWLTALGHDAADAGPVPIMSNVTMPSAELIECEIAAWTVETERSSQRAREIAADCHAAGFGYEPFDNAFFLGDDLMLLVGVGSGLYLGQGTTADFAYDGDIIYHEYGHAVAAQVGALGAGVVDDVWGLDDGPGALGEAYSDYVAAALTGDPVIGGYVSARFGEPGGIRTVEHDLVCPHYLNGEVHEDSKAWAAALWDARALFPQEEVDSETGLTVRVFDRIVYEALATLTAEANFADAAAATIEAVKAEPVLGDLDGYHVTCVFEARNVLACDRARSFCNTPIAEIYFASRGESDSMTGGVAYTPFVPGPFQLVIDLPPGATAATVSGVLANGLPSLEDPPDFIGGTTAPTTWDLRLLYKVGAPITFSYSERNNTITVTQDSDGSVDLDTSGTGPIALSANLTFPAGATRVYLALVNATRASGLIQNLRIENPGFACAEPPAAPSTVDCQSDPPPPEPPDGDEPGGCDCAAQSSPLGLLALLLLRRRRRR